MKGHLTPQMKVFGGGKTMTLIDLKTLVYQDKTKNVIEVFDKYST